MQFFDHYHAKRIDIALEVCVWTHTTVVGFEILQKLFKGVWKLIVIHSVDKH